MSSLSRLNAYRVMWLFVYFDLPTTTKKERKEYTKFKARLDKGGFSMLQYSVYIRHCASEENADVHYVITEFGTAQLFGKSIKERSRTLIEIAHPDFRDELTKYANEIIFHI